MLDLIPNGREAEELPDPQGCVVLLNALVPQGRVQAGRGGVAHVHMQMHALAPGHVSRASQTETKVGRKEADMKFRQQEGSLQYKNKTLNDTGAIVYEMSSAQGGFATNNERCV